MGQVFAHLFEQAAQAEAAARRFDADAQRRGVTSLGTEIARGQKLTCELLMGGLPVEDAVRELVWRGRPASVQFEVRVPREERPRTVIGSVLVSQDTVPIGEVKFKLKVVEAATPGRRPEPCGEARRFSKAFISYASPDRKKVLERVQMLTAAGIEFFQDVLNLDPGDRWARKLYQHIDDSDVLFLFWSRAARESEWVAREWQFALERKGDDFIRPVIIERPPLLP